MQNEKIYNSGPWTEEEKKSFAKVIREQGKNWKMAAAAVPTRDRAAIGSYAQALRNKVKKCPKHPYADIAHILEGK